MSNYKEDILRLKAEGLSYNQIVAELGCSKSTVCYYLGVDQSNKNAVRQKQKTEVVRGFIQKVKSNTPCADCGNKYPYWVMDFDHIDEKSFGINSHTKVTRSLDKIKEEIAKCEIVCANCHRGRTHARYMQNKS